MHPLLPAHGLSRDRLVEELERARVNDVDWRSGRLGVYVHFAGDDVMDVAKDAYCRFFAENGFGGSAFPSLRKFEADIIAWTASLLNGKAAVGTVTSGGTESIFLAMKAARDWAGSRRPVNGKPAVVLPESAHPAFNKAGQYLGLEMRRVALNQDYRANLEAMAHAVDKTTIAIVGSAPTMSHGVIDPIAAIGEIAQMHNLWLHVDACIGGFLGPFVRRIGYPLPDFDFCVPQVTSISADLHKYGFTAKGASTLLLRDPELLQFQSFSFDEWPRGTYRSATFAGSRPGGAIAAAWAVMRYLGLDGYERIARIVMGTRDRMIAGIHAIDGLSVIGSPDLSVVAFGSNGLDVDAIAEAMDERGWFTTQSVRPPGIHLGMLTPAHAPVADQYLSHLAQAVDEVRKGRRAVKRKTSAYGT